MTRHLPSRGSLVVPSSGLNWILAIPLSGEREIVLWWDGTIVETAAYVYDPNVLILPPEGASDLVAGPQKNLLTRYEEDSVP